jgi:hypothetical protein
MKRLELITGVHVGRLVANLSAMEATAVSIQAKRRWRSKSSPTEKWRGVPVKNRGTLLFVTGRTPGSESNK